MRSKQLSTGYFLPLVFLYIVNQPTVHASNWAINPYVKADVPVLETKTLDWQLLSKAGYQSNPFPYIGGGITIDPTYMNQFIVSVEIIGDIFKRKGGAVSGKVTFPIKEGIPYFVGAGFGIYPKAHDSEPSSTEQPDESDKAGWGRINWKNFELPIFVKAGRMTHLHNGLYLNLPQIQFTYPVAGESLPKFSLACGVQWHPL